MCFWPFKKVIVDDSNIDEEKVEVEKIYKFEITYNDNNARTVVANEFTWNEHDIVFRREGLGIFWVRSSLVQTIESKGEEKQKVKAITDEL